MKIIKQLIGGIFIMLLITACDPLEKDNLEAIGSQDVWMSADLATAYVNDIYGLLMPGTGATGRNADKTLGMYAGWGGSIDPYRQGTLTTDTHNDWPYGTIRLINEFIAGIHQATFDENLKNRLKGEILFWRAWTYFRMVQAYGGVPLILEPSPPDDVDALFFPRNKTSECFAQIIKDLDEAISLLDDITNEAGRIDKCVAKSFKGRVLLFWASPQFNRNNDISRWTDAYNANKDALEHLDAMGKGMYPDFNEIWHDQLNKEVIMVRRYSFPGFANGYSQANIRPLLYARGSAGGNIPSLELVNAFPMRDGSKWDPETMDYRLLHQNRCDRFYTSIAYNGAAPYIAPMWGNTNMWIYWYDRDGDPTTGLYGNESRSDDCGETIITGSGFYSAKMMDRDIERINVEDGQMDWVEIRYTEVLMNMAEAANEIGSTGEALDVLYAVRERANIEPGPEGKYGITATTIDELREAIQDERLVEFAFERKRFRDLIRWRIYAETLNNMENRYLHGIRTDYIGPRENRPTGLENLDEIYDQFKVEVIEDYVQLSPLEEDKYSFLGIPLSIRNRNELIENNNTWGGQFDPLL